MDTFNISTMVDEARPKRAKKGRRDVHSVYDIDYGSELGKGAYGVVRSCRHMETNLIYAAKIINKESLTAVEIEAIHSEVEVQVQLTHPNIVKIVETFETGKWLYIILEMLKGGQLRDAITSHSRLAYSETTVKRLARSLLTAVSFMHSLGVVHRDLKPANLLLPCKENLTELKISDFGFARMVGTDDHLTSATGTHAYMAPEVVSGNSTYGVAVDMWSVGVIVYLLLSGDLPFTGGSSYALSQAILSKPVDFETNPIWTKVSSGAKTFLKMCLERDPSHRVSARDALVDSWVNSITPSGSFEEHLNMVKDIANLNGGCGVASTVTVVSTGNKVFDFLNDKQYFTELDLTSSSIGGPVGGSFDILPVVELLKVNKTLNFVSLSGLRLVDSQVVPVLKALCSHPCAATLDLSNNRLTEALVKPLFQLKKRSQSLRCMLLHGTHIPGRAQQALTTAFHSTPPPPPPAAVGSSTASAAISKSRPGTAPFRPLHRSRASSSARPARPSVFVRLHNSGKS